MYKHLLIACDGSDLSQKALEQGVALAKAIGAKITILNVTLPWTSVAVGESGVALPPERYDSMAAEGAALILEKAAEVAKNAGLSCDTVHMESRAPWEGIIQTAQEREADLIVMSSHGRSGIARLLLGSQANDVVRHSTIPVLICR
ncbi:MAG: universal stress protein [Alphaproteobacteria bacterium]